MRHVLMGLRDVRVTVACAALLLMLAATPLLATKHVIQFGGSFGFAFSPKSMNVAVGDTITWTGDFSSHPLSSSTIPGGAASWANDAGSSFSYVVQVAGGYTYYCMNHGNPNGTGMAGTFTATLTSVGGSQSSVPATVHLAQNYPNPFNPSTTITFRLPARSSVSLKVYDIHGTEVATLVQGQFEAGEYVSTFDGSNLASGVYLYRVRAGTYSETKKLVLMR